MTVTSHDGTAIAYEQTGDGPPLILVEAAGHYRAFSSFTGLIGRLAAAGLTVFHYDRRGRGDSRDTMPYAVEREVDDLAALIDRAGGWAFVYAYSSGGLLTLHAAARGLNISRMALLEPPFESAEDRAAQAAFTSDLAELVAAGRRPGAVEYFLRGIGVPPDIIGDIRGTESWAAMEAVAHTLVYDSLISEATSLQLLARVTVPSLVLHSDASGDELSGMATAVAQAMPNGSHRSLPGDWHGVPDDVLAPVLAEFFVG
jgi:pimeloyl-ACP methyl ester carboxylesterase